MEIEFLSILLKQFIEYSHWGLIANFLLFLSGLLLLINLTPRDILPSYSDRKLALLKLKQNKNILGDLPKGINVTPGSAGMSIIRDQRTYLDLNKMIQEYAVEQKELDWNNVVGVGYSVLSAPVGNYKVDAFKPLYVVEIPSNNQGTTLVLKPVGQLEDFEKWFSMQHAASVNLVAIILLVVGFALQLLIEVGILGVKFF